MISNIGGIVPPMVTPLLDEDTLDTAGLERLSDHLISSGVNGLFLLGTTGEGPSLSYAIRHEMIKRVSEQVKNRVPILVNITDSSFKESVNLANRSGEYGAHAVVIAPAFYYNISQSELYEYFNKLIDEISLPVLLYNMPALTKINIEKEILEELVNRPEVIGYKDSSGDMTYFNKINQLQNRNHFSYLVGPEELLMETVMLGADGGVSGGANMFPELYVALFIAAKNGERDAALKLHHEVMRLSSVIYSGSEYGSGSIIGGIKHALHYLGLCSDYIAKPLKKVSKEKALKIEAFIDENKVPISN